jgi:hypothetical protein
MIAGAKTLADVERVQQFLQSGAKHPQENGQNGTGNGDVEMQEEEE